MDIWVRSQDKRAITKVNDIFIEEKKYDRVIDHNIHTALCYLLISIKHDKNKFILGAFDNKEDALQVINEFQDHVVETENKFLYYCASAHPQPMPSYDIFQIPEDKYV